VSPGDYVLHIQNGSDLLRDQFAIGVRDTSGLVDENPDDSAGPATQYLDFDDFEAFAQSKTLGDRLYLSRNCAAVCHIIF